MNEALHAFDEMIVAVCTGDDFFQNWRSYEDKQGRSADAICSAVWNSTAPMPRAIASLAGAVGAGTYAEAAQAVRDWFPEPSSQQHSYVAKIKNAEDGRR